MSRMRYRQRLVAVRGLDVPSLKQSPPLGRDLTASRRSSTSAAQTTPPGPCSLRVLLQGTHPQLTIGA
jgi:hypothetical protein